MYDHSFSKPSKSKHAAGVLRLPTLQHASAFYSHPSPPSLSGPLGGLALTCRGPWSTCALPPDTPLPSPR